MSNRHVVQYQVEPQRSPLQVVAYKARHHFTLGDQLGGIELGYDRLQDLIDNRGEDALVVIGSEFTVYYR